MTLVKARQRKEDVKQRLATSTRKPRASPTRLHSGYSVEGGGGGGDLEQELERERQALLQTRRQIALARSNGEMPELSQMLPKVPVRIVSGESAGMWMPRSTTGAFRTSTSLADLQQAEPSASEPSVKHESADLCLVAEALGKHCQPPFPPCSGEADAAAAAAATASLDAAWYAMRLWSHASCLHPLDLHLPQTSGSQPCPC